MPLGRILKIRHARIVCGQRRPDGKPCLVVLTFGPTPHDKAIQKIAMNPIGSSVSLLTSKEAAERLRLRPNTLEIWRTKGIGPNYRKVGRAVRYVEAEVLDWLDAQTRVSTSQIGRGADARRQIEGVAR